MVVVLAMYGIPFLIYLAFAVPALLFLRRRALDETSRAVWALAIIAVPITGPVAFATIDPGSRQG